MDFGLYRLCYITKITILLLTLTLNRDLWSLSVNWLVQNHAILDNLASSDNNIKSTFFFSFPYNRNTRLQWYNVQIQIDLDQNSATYFAYIQYHYFNQSCLISDETFLANISVSACKYVSVYICMCCLLMKPLKAKEVLLCIIMNGQSQIF